MTNEFFATSCLDWLCSVNFIGTIWTNKLLLSQALLLAQYPRRSGAEEERGKIGNMPKHADYEMLFELCGC